MKYTKQERMDIARRIYDGELTIAAAAVRYGLNISSIKGYLRLYRETNSLPPKARQKRTGIPTHGVWPDYDSDYAFTSRIMVQPFADGTFRYLSNSIEQKELEIPRVESEVRH